MSIITRTETILNLMSRSTAMTSFKVDGKNLRLQERKIKMQLKEMVLKHRRNLGMSMLKITQLRKKLLQVHQKKESLLTMMMIKIKKMSQKIVEKIEYLKTLSLKVKKK